MTVKLSNEFIEQSTMLLKNKNIEELNKILKVKTGLINFFETYNEYVKFKEILNLRSENSEKDRDMGDFQTPKQLTDKICEHLFNIGINPLFLIEPTCGTGNFVISALEYFPKLKYIYCIEIQEEYEWYFKLNLLCKSFEQPINIDIEFHKDNIFTHRFSNKFLRLLNKSSEHNLILGNPPWVTNTELSVLNSDNIPLKSNIKGHKGIEAITGKGNFDIAEYIIIQMVKKFSKYKGKIAMLCKTSVIKNIVKDIDKLNMRLSNIKSLQIDTKKEFNINADAALFLADLGYDREKYCTVSSLYQPNHKYNIFGWIDNKFVSDTESYKKYKFLDGKSEFIWRQGVKHDATKIMVLKENAKGLHINGLNEIVKIEDNCLYPFIKSSDLKERIIKACNKKVIITQASLKDDTNKIALKYPKLWNYLLKHSEYLDNRKSIIYKNRPRFSIFGIGDYAFKPYRVAISGFYKIPIFSLIFPINDKPVMLDDTCYYLSFNKFEDAFFTWILFNTTEIKNFLRSIVFLKSKRPYTKEKLMRINLANLLDTLSFEEISRFYQKNLRKFLFYDFSKENFLKYKSEKFPKVKSLLHYI
ncbi:MAG: SAM-dependent methyltransferase [Candidatus Helarchaeota archaeon]|nr:SAM-dependent methyltransferase [Candidatus Helarchaeota archaeon]